MASSHKLIGCKNSISFDDFGKDIWQQKKKKTIALRYGFNLFLVGCFSTSPFNDLFTSSSNIFTIIEWFAFTCFFNVVITFVVLYKTKPCLNVTVTKHNWATITKNTFHGLSLKGISHLHVCYYSHKKEIEHKCFLPFDFQIVL